MTYHDELIARLSGSPGGSPLFVPDLTLWYEWHHREGTLPAEWQGLSMAAIARRLGAPIWQPVRPWRTDMPGIRRELTEQDGRRTLCYQTPAGDLTAEWTLGPDGDWWQEKHLVTDKDDLPAALLLAEAMEYRLETAALAGLENEVGDDGVLVLELPRRPYSDLLHDFVGWGEGILMLAGKSKDRLMAIHDILDAKLQTLAAQVAKLPGRVVLSPDNLDGQYISPKVFQQTLTPSYAATAEQLHAHDKLLVVHAGGPSRRLLPLLADAGVDCVEGIAGPPQADATLVEAREAAGPKLVLWGGLPQGYVMRERRPEQFEAALEQALADAKAAEPCLLGVADRVPTMADMDRLKIIVERTNR